MTQMFYDYDPLLYYNDGSTTDAISTLPELTTIASWNDTTVLPDGVNFAEMTSLPATEKEIRITAFDEFEDGLGQTEWESLADSSTSVKITSNFSKSYVVEIRVDGYNIHTEIITASPNQVPHKLEVSTTTNDVNILPTIEVSTTTNTITTQDIVLVDVIPTDMLATSITTQDVALVDVIPTNLLVSSITTQDIVLVDVASLDILTISSTTQDIVLVDVTPLDILTISSTTQDVTIVSTP